MLGPLLGRDLIQNIPDLNKNSQINEIPRSFADLAIADKFSTNQASFYRTGNKEVDFSAISHQLLGERALDLSLWGTAVDYLGRSIACTPENPLPYLERGVAHFSLGLGC